jgi:hypothetical protein
MGYMQYSKFLILIFLAVAPYAWSGESQKVLSDNFRISGYIRDVKNGEALFGATIFIKEIDGGTTANPYGFYTISLKEKDYTIECRFLGYKTQTIQITLDENIDLNIELEEENRELEEVEIIGQIDKSNIEKSEISLNRFDIKTIKVIPAFLGEVDIIQSIQLLPGVSTVGEGTSGFNVRGGSVGQNLILMDEVPVFNSSHLMGFFSIFNPDAVRDIRLYKGGIPARYGGRISSIMDIRMKEGNSKQFTLQGGIGTIFSRIAIEAPIVKDKFSFIFSARRSYIDVLAKPIVDELDEETKFYFYDLTLNSRYDFNENNKIYLSAYLGRDVFKVNAVQGFDWGSKLASLRWNHLFNKKFFANFNFIYSEYQYGLAFFDDLIDRLEWDSKIRVGSFKPQFTYFLNTNDIIEFGAEFNYYSITPAHGLVVSNYDSTIVQLPEKYAAEWSFYINNDQLIGQHITLKYGLRGSGYLYLGPGFSYEYETIFPGKRKLLVSQKEIKNRDPIQKYFNLEPRFAFNYEINSISSIKAAYSRLSQNIHLISNTTATNPLDIWIPSTNNIKPEIGNQISLGYLRNFGNRNVVNASIEAFYRSNKNLIEYIDGAQIYVNEYIEAELLAGIGRSYGMEFYAEKTSGKIQGWVSYTAGRSESKVSGINNGDWYPSRYDQLHNLKLVGFFKLNEKWSFSSTFAYLSGTPTTFPTTRLDIQNYLIPYNYYYSRNNKRISSYHRLDIAVTLNSKRYNRKGKEKKYRDYWVFGVYNLYARENPFSVYFSQGSDRPATGEPIPSFATQMAVIGTIVPGISYNFRF